MHTAILTAKCQLVLPAPLRRAHGLKPRARVVIENHADGILVRPASGDNLPEYVPPMRPGTLKLTAAEYHLHATFGDSL